MFYLLLPSLISKALKTISTGGDARPLLLEALEQANTAYAYYQEAFINPFEALNLPANAVPVHWAENSGLSLKIALSGALMRLSYKVPPLATAQALLNTALEHAQALITAESIEEEINYVH